MRPVGIQGAWRVGWALDVHTVYSEFFGYDEAGHAQFDTTRSPLGESVFQLKYRGKADAAAEIAGAMADFLREKPNALARTDAIVPMPASIARATQPVAQIGEALGSLLGKPCLRGAVRKVRDTPELKNVHDPERRRELLDEAFESEPSLVAGKGVLLIDDLYRSGATANAVTLALLRAQALRVYFLAATRTRSQA